MCYEENKNEATCSRSREARLSQSIFFFQAEDGIRDVAVTGVQTCALPISQRACIAEDRADAQNVHWVIGLRKKPHYRGRVINTCVRIDHEIDSRRRDRFNEYGGAGPKKT